jgi:hypothetical protein
MAQDTSEAAGGSTVVIPGEMAARVDRLPVSLMIWEIFLLVQVGWACAGSADWIARVISAGFVFALSSWAGVAAASAYLLNALFSERLERKYTQLVGAILFAGSWYGIYAVHNTPAVVTLFIISNIGAILWVWSMYVYIPANFPTRMRSLGTGWTERRRPPRRLGRRPPRRKGLHRGQATFEPALLMRVENFSFCGCIAGPWEILLVRAVPPCAARRRFARRLSVQSGR